MSFETFPQYPPVDADLVDRIVCKLKAQGIFDQFRKDCLADVDTKPAYQNLQQRVHGTVSTFLSTQTWQEDLNKTQLRESLRRHVQQGFLEVGVDRIVDQVVNPKVFTVFMPKVEDIVYDCLGIEKPKHPSPLNNPLTGRKLTLLDLLPKDLDPVSPDSDNLSFGDDDETKDETNNNDSTSKLDISHDSQVSGISDLSSHMGDDYKENQENHVDSNTVKSVTSVKEGAPELHFDNFENLSEKIKQAEIGHNSIVSTQPDEPDNIETKSTNFNEDNNILRDNREEKETSMEIDSVSSSTFDDNKMFNSSFVKDDTCSRMVSEDSLSCSSFSSKLKKDKAKSFLPESCVNSQDKSEVSTPCKESSSDKEVKVLITNEDSQLKVEEKVLENKDSIKSEEPKDKKHRDSSSSSKTRKNSSDRYRSESKHRSSNEKKDDSKQNKEKMSKEDKDKVNRDDKDKSSRHKDDRQNSSRDKHRDKDKTHDRNKEKDSEKRKDKTDPKDISEKDKLGNEKENHKHDRGKDRSEKEKDRHEKGKTDKEKERREKDKERQEKDKERHDREKDKHEKSKRDKEKKDKPDGKDKERDRGDSNKDRNRDKEKSKSEKERKNEKDKESIRSVEDRNRDDRKKESKKYDQSSSKKDESSKSDMKDKTKKNDENPKEKYSEKEDKNGEERRERKRKSERCIDEVKLKEARRSWDRDNGGANGKSHSSHKTNNNDCKGSSSTSSSKEKKTSESSNQQKTSERTIDPVCDAEEPSDVDKILMKINSSIDESQNDTYSDEISVKKPKIAKNIFEIKKIMQARKNLARQMRHEKKKKDSSNSGQEDDVTDSSSTAHPVPQEKNITIDENKENIKTGQTDKMKTPKICHTRGKFTGFLDSDIEKSRSCLEIFQSRFFNYCQSIGLNIGTTENIDFNKICDINDEFVDDNLNNVKPQPVSVERRNYHDDDDQVNKAVENIINGKNGCYVLLKDCTEYVKSIQKQTPRDSPTIEGSQSVVQLSSTSYRPEEDSSKATIPIISEQHHSKVKDNTPKDKPNSFSALPGSALPIQECVVQLKPEFVLEASQQLLITQQVATVKKGTCSTASKHPSKQDQQNDEPSSPDITISVALNQYLNDIERPPSVPLTEAMLDNLMMQSSLQVEDEVFEESDDSDNEQTSLVQDRVIKIEENHTLFDQKVPIEHITQNESEASLHSAKDVISDEKVLDKATNCPRSNKVRDSFDHTSGCEIVDLKKGSPPEACEEKTVKRRNQRLSRCASQRYDNNDLYKPRPVLPQNAKRVRTPRTVSSEELEGQYEGTPMRKRAR